MYQLMIRDTFCAAHKLRFYDGKCENLHGHNYKVEIVIGSPDLNKIGLAIDFYDLRKILRQILDQLDHTVLNELALFSSLNPSAENISFQIWQLLRKDLLPFENIELLRVNVWESENCMASYCKEKEYQRQ